MFLREMLLKYLLLFIPFAIANYSCSATKVNSALNYVKEHPTKSTDHINAPHSSESDLQQSSVVHRKLHISISTAHVLLYYKDITFQSDVESRVRVKRRSGKVKNMKEQYRAVLNRSWNAVLFIFCVSSLLSGSITGLIITYFAYIRCSICYDQFVPDDVVI
ncbi:hypothetical protein AB6A40_002197 [Gnathostoma spinigerum]|uniref:Uncharacterized protein n=1 Tax=Gnathostoma spinigerum TaxID=75299 RepID=A0ABD6E5Z0_9BILA